MENFSFRYKLLLFFVVFLGSGFLTADAATLSLSPSSTSTTVGNIFSVNILLNTQGTSTNGVDIRYLNFPASLLEVQDDGGASGIQINAGTLMSPPITNTVDNSLGRIEFSQLGSYGSGYNGNGTLATIRFKALTAGTANVTFNFTSGATTDTNVDAGGIDILTSVTNGAYTINNAQTNFSSNQIIEAESGQISAPMQTGVSGADTYVYTPSVDNTGSVKFYFNISQAGQYKMEAKVNSNNSIGQNSFFVGLDNELAQGNNLYAYHFPTSTSFIWDEVSKWGNGTTSPQFDPMTWNLTQGTHFFTFYGREFNTWLDQIRLVSITIDTTPPVLSSGSPSGQLAAGTTQATLSLTTNENATCRYSTTAGTAYSAMVNTFSTTGALNHSTNVSNLTNGSSYTYYVRCQDTSSPPNANTIDFTISFSVASGGGGGDTTLPTIPTNLMATAISALQINLSWTASTDNIGVSGYRIYRCAGSACSPTVQIATSPTNSYSNINLTQSTAYIYAVVAYDAAGNVSSQSATSTTTTLSLDTTPPVLSGGSPSGELVAGITQAVLSLTTNENATCRYSTTAGTAYSAMINIISTVLTTNHSTNISGLDNGNSYTYYVACQNTDGYANTSDYLISFSIALASTGGGGGGGGGGGTIVPPSGGGGGGGGGGGTTVSNPPSGGLLTPVQIRNLVIRKPNGILIAEKDIVDTSILNFEAQVLDSGGQKVRLEVELRKFDEQFTNAPTLFSEYVDSGKIAIISRGGLVDGSYRLRARTRRFPDPNIIGAEAVSEWLWFGDQNTRDFTILQQSSQTPATTPTTSGFQYSFNSNMSLGMKNKDVEALQKVLNLEGVYSENIVSGYFGSLTQKAVIAFQNKYNISPAIGTVGPLTRAKLNGLYEKGTSPIVLPVITPTTSGFQYSFNSNMSLGMKNKDVEALQKVLNLEGVYSENIMSGYFGSLTQKAVIAFQNKYNISPAIGAAGPLTRAKLNGLYGGKTSALPETTPPLTKEPLTGELVGPFAIGMQSEQVKLLQTLLSKDPEIYPEAKITGYYGQMTITAVKRFQAKYGIEETGLAGPTTRAKINEILGK